MVVHNRNEPYTHAIEWHTSTCVVCIIKDPQYENGSHEI